MKKIMTYETWEARAIFYIAKRLECDEKNATDIWEAQQFYQAKLWSEGATPTAAAKFILNRPYTELLNNLK
jgi:hypothetical protein